MKKTMLVLAITAMAVFMFASSALALGPAYSAWTSVGANAGSLPTPHKDYQLNTEKCSVCHSVHAARNGLTAQAGIAEAASGKDAELLLRSSVADACTYCHISTSIGVKVVYAGDITQYETGATDTNPYAHNHGHASCVGCHSVHGAATVGGAGLSLTNTVANDVSTKILKSGTYQPELLTAKGLVATDVNNGADTAGNGYLGNRQGYVSVFCSQCHSAYSGASETAITGTSYWSPTHSPNATVTYKNHPMKGVGVETAGNLFTAQGASFTDKAVAFAGSDYCRSCHSAGTDGSSNAVGTIVSSFPHSTPGAANFLNSGADVTAPTGTQTGAAGPAAQGADGVCLRCHRDGAGKGVGLNF